MQKRWRSFLGGLVILAVGQGVCAFGQGLVNFNNKVPEENIDARFEDAYGGLISPYWKAALAVSREDGGITVIPGSETTFQQGAGSGYLVPKIVAVPGYAAGRTVNLRMVAYNGSSFETSQCTMMSQHMTIMLGAEGGMIPVLRELTGLKGGCEALPGAGYILFSNREPEHGIDARFLDGDGRGLTSPPYKVALALAKEDGSLQVLPGSTSYFGFGSRSGYFEPVAVPVPGKKPGETALITVVIWAGESYETASVLGRTGTYTTALGGGGNIPPQPIYALTTFDGALPIARMSFPELRIQTGRLLWNNNHLRSQYRVEKANNLGGPWSVLVESTNSMMGELALDLGLYDQARAFFRVIYLNAEPPVPAGKWSYEGFGEGGSLRATGTLTFSENNGVLGGSATFAAAAGGRGTHPVGSGAMRNVTRQGNTIALELPSGFQADGFQLEGQMVYDRFEGFWWRTEVLFNLEGPATVVRLGGRFSAIKIEE